MTVDGGGGKAAAFFDLDKTLMEGSSAFQFARAAYRNGMMSRRLEEGLPEAQRRARARLAHESWAEKARTFEEWVLGR